MKVCCRGEGTLGYKPCQIKNNPDKRVRDILIGDPPPSWFAVVASQQRGGTGLGGDVGSRVYGSLINNAETFCLQFIYFNRLSLQQK